MLIVPPPAAEQIVQILLSRFGTVLRRVRIAPVGLAPDRIDRVVLFPVALQRLFFLGLYNNCLSLTGAILCIWAYLRLRARVSSGAGVVLATLLLLTLGCQASGWMEAVVALGTMELTETGLRWRDGERGWPLVRRPAVTVLCGAPGAALFALFALWGPGDRHVTYGPRSARPSDRGFSRRSVRPDRTVDSPGQSRPGADADPALALSRRIITASGYRTRPIWARSI